MVENKDEEVRLEEPINLFNLRRQEEHFKKMVRILGKIKKEVSQEVETAVNIGLLLFGDLGKDGEDELILGEEFEGYYNGSTYIKVVLVKDEKYNDVLDIEEDKKKIKAIVMKQLPYIDTKFFLNITVIEFNSDNVETGDFEVNTPKEDNMLLNTKKGLGIETVYTTLSVTMGIKDDEMLVYSDTEYYAERKDKALAKVFQERAPKIVADELGYEILD